MSGLDAHACTRRATLLPPASCSTQLPFQHQSEEKAVPARFVPPRLPKRKPRTIRNVRPVRCQGQGAGSKPPSEQRPLAGDPAGSEGAEGLKNKGLGSEGAMEQESPCLILSALFAERVRARGCPRWQGRPPGCVLYRSLTNPLLLLYRKGRHLESSSFPRRRSRFRPQHEGDGMKVLRRETGIRCRNALADSRGNRALVHDVGALELVEGRAAPRS